MSEYRSFRLFKYSPPDKTAANYSEAEKEQFRIAFRPVASRYRLLGYMFFASLLAGWLFWFFTKRSDWGWAFGGAVIFWIIYWILFGPVCPACKRKVDNGVRTFCPECGGKVRPGSFFKATHCLSCGKDLWCGKRCSYEIHCCTHCGIFLDGKRI